MSGLTAMAAALFALAAGGKAPPPLGYYVRDNHPLTPELVRAQDACAEEAFRKVRDRRGRYDHAQYEAAFMRCVTERKLLGEPQSPPQSGLPGLRGGPTGDRQTRMQTINSGWLIDGYVFDKYPGFDDAGNVRPDRPPTPAEIAAVKRCLPLASSKSLEVAAAFINRCLTDLGHGRIFLVRVPPLPR
jgi:hypothetical protein